MLFGCSLFMFLMHEPKCQIHVLQWAISKLLPASVLKWGYKCKAIDMKMIYLLNLLQMKLIITRRVLHLALS